MRVEKKNSLCLRIMSIMLAIVISCTILPVTKSFAVESIDPDTNSAMIADNKNAATIDSLLNQQTLHPQKTGYAALDKMLEQIIGPVRNKSVAEQMKYCYEWTVKNIDYSWDGYTGVQSGYNGFDLKKHPYPYNDYEADLQKAFPEEVIARTYYTMKYHKGVCYDWGAVYAVMVRYIGLDAYVHTGMYKFESELYANPGRGHHGWTEVVLSGKYYIFDPQREYRFTKDGKGTVSFKKDRFFGLASGDKFFSHYTEETSINKTRDAGFLSVTAHRQKLVQINAVASRSGTVSGSGKYDITSKATLTAAAKNGAAFDGWYDAAGKKLSSSLSYTFTVTGPTTVYAMFQGDYFYDVNDQWYAAYAIEAAKLGLISGTAPFKFDANTALTRAMAVQILARMDGVDLNAYKNRDSGFQDVASGAWYAPAVTWAKEAGIVSGTSAEEFSPNTQVTREQFAQIVYSYLNNRGIDTASGTLNFADADKVSEWAVEALEHMQAEGLISGFPDDTLRPRSDLTRAQGVTIFMRTIELIQRSEMGEPQPV